MKLTGNIIFITGGGSGIGRGLAEAFHALGNQVIISGRRLSVLETVCMANPGMQCIVFNADDRQDIKRIAQHLAAKAPGVNVLINNAGIQRPENLLNQQEDLADAESTITTNLLGPIRITAALLPLLIKQSRSAILNVTSGLAFLPMSGVPTYCATKAAMHSYTMSLRQQLKSTNTEVIELIPPYVQTELGPAHGADPMAMPLTAFISEVMQILQANPKVAEVVVEQCKSLRFASGGSPPRPAEISDSNPPPV